MKNFIKKFLSFFKTAPKIKSDLVLRLEESGEIYKLFEAMEDLEKNKSDIGYSKDKSIYVKKVGKCQKKIY